MAKKRKTAVVLPKNEIESRKSNLFLPPTKILRPMTPYERRMTEFGKKFGPPPDHPDAIKFSSLIETQMKNDASFQRHIKEVEKLTPHFLLSRQWGGSGFIMSRSLRWYFGEYFQRMNTLGPHSFPTSFNVVEAFFRYKEKFCAFDLRTELEHLLTAGDYFEWYDSVDIPLEPNLLFTVMDEGIVYSYNMAFDSNGYRVAGKKSTFVIAGVSLIRHGDEISCLMIAGENPPHLSEEELASKLPEWEAAKGKKGVTAAKELGIKDRYLDEHPDFSRIVLLTRFDIRTNKHDVRYINLDYGKGFLILTDDFACFDDLSPMKQIAAREQQTMALNEYSGLFSSAAALIYLPVSFISESDNVREMSVKTEIWSKRDEKAVKKAAKALGDGKLVYERVIRCLASSRASSKDRVKSVIPPEMESQKEGFWKPIHPGQIGQDKHGNRIVGKTWVSRLDMWSASSPGEFLIQRSDRTPQGQDPGILYVVRSAAHDDEIYKIGLTRRNAEVRAAELSSTGVPLAFALLAQWEVGDCSGIEREVHARLDAYRINPHREFFRTSLREIISTINSVVTELEPDTTIT